MTTIGAKVVGGVDTAIWDVSDVWDVCAAAVRASCCAVACAAAARAVCSACTRAELPMKATSPKTIEELIPAARILLA